MFGLRPRRNDIVPPDARATAGPWAIDSDAHAGAGTGVEKLLPTPGRSAAMRAAEPGSLNKPSAISYQLSARIVPAASGRKPISEVPNYPGHSRDSHNHVIFGDPTETTSTANSLPIAVAPATAGIVNTSRTSSASIRTLYS